jgi:hypothetical protein
MKKWFFTLLAAGFLTGASAQTTASKVPPVDKSPMDMAYYPVDYPVLKIKEKTTEPLVARVIYSRPQRNNRTIFGELVEYNSVWRLGANEATEIEFYREVKIGGKKIPKGRYTLYALVKQDQWTFILNKDTDTWGAFKYDEKKDVARVSAPVSKPAEPIESFSMSFNKTSAGTELVVAWDTVMVRLPIALK